VGRNERWGSPLTVAAPRGLFTHFAWPPGTVGSAQYSPGAAVQLEKPKMSKSSSVTVRETLPQRLSTSGQLSVHAESLLIPTDTRIQLVDITETVMEQVRRSGIREGLASLWSMHTTCALFINEAQKALHADILRVLEEVVDRDAEWMHNDPQHSDCDRMNADSHLRAMLLGHSLTLQISAGEPVLGQWQRVLVAEMDGPRARTIRMQLMGLQ
jgi:secondary thiamine-phosphate synthase enzyme